VGTGNNSLAPDRPRFKFSDLLEEEEEDEGKDITSTSQKPPDSFKFFAAVPGSSAS
jgi:hypothetical protein